MNKKTIANITAEINALKITGASPTELTQKRHALVDAVRNVVRRRLQNQRVRAGRERIPRLCITCKTNIDDRGNRATYCEQCANRRREEKEREYRRDYDAKRRGKS